MLKKYVIIPALIAAIYCALIFMFMPVSFGTVQIRVAEALTVLPYFTPSAIYGLFIGCFLANLIGGAGILDIVLGSLATLLAAFLTYRMKSKWLAPFPPIVINAFVVGYILNVYYGMDYWLAVASVAAGQTVSCLGLGMLLLLQLDKYKERLFS
ncbi:MAG: QueT transporter family protein [Clostridia bacterium]|nr:QueT transporter family protein [Clostridia bacterium]